MRTTSSTLLVIIALGVVIFFAVGCDGVQRALDKLPKGSTDGPSAADPMDDPSWQALKSQAMSKVRVAAGWGAPELVPGAVNSTGWEDSASISADGLTLLFAYVPADFHGLATKGRMDLNKFDQYRRGPSRGNVLDFAFDTFRSEKVNGLFQAPQKHWISVNSDPPQASESGATQVGDFVYFNNNHPTTPTEHTVHVWRARMNERPVKLTFCGSSDENDPAFLDGEMYFWSEGRKGGPGGGKKYLWLTKQTGDNQWTDPVCLPEPINLKGSDTWQCHPTSDGRLFFTSNRESGLSIYESTRTGPFQWKAPTKVVWVEDGGAAIGVAEPSLTGDSQELYFCVLFRNSHGSFDLDIARTRRLPK